MMPVQLEKWGRVAQDKCEMVTVIRGSVRFGKHSVVWGDTARRRELESVPDGQA